MVIRVANPDAADIPEFTSIIQRGLRSIGKDATREQLRAMIASPQEVITVLPFSCILLMRLPVRGGIFETPPFVSLFYNEASRAEGKEVLDFSVDLLRQLGYSKAWALNSSGYPDKVWARGLTPTGWRASHKASLYEFGA